MRLHHFLNERIFLTNLSIISHVDPPTFIFIPNINAKSTSSSSSLKYSVFLFPILFFRSSTICIPASFYRHHSTYHRVISYGSLLLFFRNLIIASQYMSLLSLSLSLSPFIRSFFNFFLVCFIHESVAHLKIRMRKWKKMMILIGFSSNLFFKFNHQRKNSNISSFTFFLFLDQHYLSTNDVLHPTRQ